MTDASRASIERLFAEAQAHHHAGRLEEAQRLYAEIVERAPRHADALNLLGAVLVQRVRHEQAAPFLRRATEAAPGRAPYWCNYGVALLALGRYDEAKAAFERALRIDPRNVDAYYNLGNLLKAMELPDAALMAYEQARSIDPSRVDALINMGNILFDIGRLDEAIACYERTVDSVARGPSMARALINLGNVHRRRGDADRAVAAYDRALAVQDHDGLRIKRALTVPVIYRDRDHIHAVRHEYEMRLRELAERDLRVSDPALEISSTSFFLAYHGQSDRRLQELAARLHLKACPRLGFVAPHCARPRTRARLRVAFVSAYFRRHSVGRLMEGLIAGMPRTEFEVVVVTQPGALDAVARRIGAAAERVVTLPDGYEPARRAIAGIEADVLVYPEIGMDVRAYFLAFARLAPVQCAMWGHPDTTGIPNLDWFVSSTLTETAGADAHYSEKLYRLDTLPTRYRRPDVPTERKSKTDFGFAADQNVYLCVQSAIKHHPDLDMLVAEILRRDGRAVVALMEGAVGQWTDDVRRRIAARLPDVAPRVRFVPRMAPEDFVALIGAADVVFDTPHFSGGNTSYEAFAMGKPVVTHAGELMRGRVTLGQYRAMGQIDEKLGDEFASGGIEDCATIAVRLGTDPDYRADAEARVQAAAAALWDDDRAVAELARFLRFAAGRDIR